MDDRSKFYKDAATVLSIVKYLLIFAIIGLVVYFGASILVILIPFAIGLILARTAYMLSYQWRKLLKWLASVTGKHKWKITERRSGLAPARSEARAAGVFYILVVIVLLAALVGIIAATISQVRSLASYIPDFVKDTSLIERITEILANWSGRLGGLVDESIINMISSSLLGLQEQLINALPGSRQYT